MVLKHGDTAMQMKLSEYLNGAGNFHKYDARLIKAPNHGGKITAHHGRDKSTDKYYDAMDQGEFLIAFTMPNGDHKRCQIIRDQDVSCVLTR